MPISGSSKTVHLRRELKSQVCEHGEKNMKVLFRAGFLLILLVHREQVTEAVSLETNKETDTVKAEDVCVAVDDSKPSDFLYIGNGSSGAIPVLQFKLSEIISFKSQFELRTFDPEGILFFGDIGGEHNWFLLALRKHYLEIQFPNDLSQTAITGGPFISDGEWKQISIANLNSTIIVTVNKEEVIRNHQPMENEDVEGKGVLRIGIGAMFPNSSLKLTLNPPLDGCLRNWDWVRQETPILNRLIESSESQRCWKSVVPGSYFPGYGAAQFESHLFIDNLSMKETENWSLTVELSLRPVVANGILFAILDLKNNLSFSIALNDTQQAFTLTFAGKDLGSLRFPPELCSGEFQVQQLILANKQLVFKSLEDEVIWNVADDFEALQAVWDQPGTTVYLGGLPDWDPAAVNSYYHGCMRVKIQGNRVDVDTAKNKYGGIRSHSCPADLQLGVGK